VQKGPASTNNTVRFEKHRLFLISKAKGVGKGEKKDEVERGRDLMQEMKMRKKVATIPIN
jgi:hypothetical protein